ncbi:TIGR01459 family HAD-type hydrolase [Litoreibacter roseus]|uniref:Haloacid dehalogenase n=1 Tax=Litoreibacter roseus TaxID=2601869 RepID=A0A6N6JJP1_9RHOB|nr:TIGR01459 family HAD-type hydrolase [Litoreibacter roseus]GFE66506.1 haloacid dehalogenase [Litoreibacter roseus]
MTHRIERMAEIAGSFDAIVFDQWGVLHDGSAPYSGAVEALRNLSKQASGPKLGVLSNSGKRADLNLARISAMGFSEIRFDCVMTSGEALWLDISTGHLTAGRSLFAITRDPDDADDWATGLDIELAHTVDAAEAILLMGIPDDGATPEQAEALDAAVVRGLPIYCSNPDVTSPRAGGALVTSPGALAHEAAKRGVKVVFYGKPHGPVFTSISDALAVAPERTLIVGDSLHHDIAGGHAAGWATCLIAGGIHATDLSSDAMTADLKALTEKTGTPQPTYVMETLR